MFILQAEKNQLKAVQTEPITSGSVNVYQVRFQFSPDWDGLERIAVFQAGWVSRSVALNEDGVCMIPWEPLVEPGTSLSVGVYGTLSGNMVLPTVWARLGVIQQGTMAGPGAKPPTPEVWRMELAKKADRIGYTEGGELGLYSGEELLVSIPILGAKSAVHSDEIDSILVMDRAEYLALEEKDSRTMYLLRG